MDLGKAMIACGIYCLDGIKQSAVDAETYGRGYDYARNGNVQSIKQIGDTLVANVVGSQTNPYQVVIVFDIEDKSYHATCTCPDQRVGNCKHIIATFIKIAYDNSFVTVVPKLADTRKQMLNNIYEHYPIMAKIAEQHKDKYINADLLRITWALISLTPDEFSLWLKNLEGRKDALPQSAKGSK